MKRFGLPLRIMNTVAKIRIVVNAVTKNMLFTYKIPNDYYRKIKELLHFEEARQRRAIARG